MLPFCYTKLTFNNRLVSTFSTYIFFKTLLYFASSALFDQISSTSKPLLFFFCCWPSDSWGAFGCSDWICMFELWSWGAWSRTRFFLLRFCLLWFICGGNCSVKCWGLSGKVLYLLLPGFDWTLDYFFIFLDFDLSDTLETYDYYRNKGDAISLVSPYLLRLCLLFIYNPLSSSSYHRLFIVFLNYLSFGRLIAFIFDGFFLCGLFSDFCWPPEDDECLSI